MCIYIKSGIEREREKKETIKLSKKFHWSKNQKSTFHFPALRKKASRCVRKKVYGTVIALAIS